MTVETLKVRFSVLAEFHLFELDGFAFAADDSLGTAVTLAKWLLKILVLFDNGHGARLLDFAVKAEQKILKRFFGIFTGYCNHGRKYNLTDRNKQTRKAVS